MKKRTRNWPTDYDNMLKPYGRWPVAIIDAKNRVWKRSEVKGWFEFVHYDNRPNGGYCGSSKHLTHPDMRFGRYIWSKKELNNL